MNDIAATPAAGLRSKRLRLCSIVSLTCFVHLQKFPPAASSFPLLTHPLAPLRSAAHPQSPPVSHPICPEDHSPHRSKKAAQPRALAPSPEPPPCHANRSCSCRH